MKNRFSKNYVQLIQSLLPQGRAWEMHIEPPIFKPIAGLSQSCLDLDLRLDKALDRVSKSAFLSIPLEINKHNFTKIQELEAWSISQPDLKHRKFSLENLKKLLELYGYTCLLIWMEPLR